MISTDPEENFVEIRPHLFTKLLQVHTYNILHTRAARVETFVLESLKSNSKLSLSDIVDAGPGCRYVVMSRVFLTRY